MKILAEKLIDSVGYPIEEFMTYSDEITHNKFLMSVALQVDERNNISPKQAAIVFRILTDIRLLCALYKEYRCVS
jgi:hypothetical protein